LSSISVFVHEVERNVTYHMNDVV
jgi:caffeic acid 3-O-methyltransferase